MIKKIISGGQTGADIAGIHAAIETNFPYSGWLPKNRLTEKGSLSEKYSHFKTMTRGGYPARTKQNIIDSDATLIFTHGKLTGGSLLTKKTALKLKKPVLHINLSELDKNGVVSLIIAFLNGNNIEVLNIAGSRASKDLEIHNSVYSVIKEIIRKQAL